MALSAAPASHSSPAEELELPVFPASKVVHGEQLSIPETGRSAFRRGTVVLETEADIETVARFYQQQEPGLTRLQQNSPGGETVVLVPSGGYTEGARGLRVIIQRRPGRNTRIHLTRFENVPPRKNP